MRTSCLPIAPASSFCSAIRLCVTSATAPDSRACSAATAPAATFHIGMWSSVVWNWTTGAIATPGAAAMPLSLRVILDTSFSGTVPQFATRVASSRGAQVPIDGDLPRSPMKRPPDNRTKDNLPSFLDESTVEAEADLAFEHDPEAEEASELDEPTGLIEDADVEPEVTEAEDEAPRAQPEVET